MHNAYIYFGGNLNIFYKALRYFTHFICIHIITIFMIRFYFTLTTWAYFHIQIKLNVTVNFNILILKIHFGYFTIIIHHK